MINILANRYSIDADWCFDVFKHYIKPNCKVAMIPFSFRSTQMKNDEDWQGAYSKEGLYYDGMVNALRSYGIGENQIQWINYFTDTKEKTKKKVRSADLLYFTGGLPDQMMKRLKEFDLIKDIEAHQGILLGFSAGALIQLKNYHLSPDSDYPNFQYEKGLNILKDFYLEVHFEHRKTQVDSIQKILIEQERPVYAIEDEGALIEEQGQIKTVGKVSYYKVGDTNVI